LEPPNIAHIYEDLYFFFVGSYLGPPNLNLSIERRSIHMKAVEKTAVPFNKRAVIGIILCGLILGMIMGLLTIFSPE
jgi:membrane protein DedA with SNARE-associated domain